MEEDSECVGEESGPSRGEDGHQMGGRGEQGVVVSIVGSVSASDHFLSDLGEEESVDLSVDVGFGWRDSCIAFVSVVPCVTLFLFSFVGVVVRLSCVSNIGFHSVADFVLLRCVITECAELFVVVAVRVWSGVAMGLCGAVAPDEIHVYASHMLFVICTIVCGVRFQNHMCFQFRVRIVLY